LAITPSSHRYAGGLLNQEWDRDAVLERAKVIFTLINTHGNTIRRMALGGGTWKGTGAETIGNNLVLTKLYYKRDGANRPREEGFTVFEFHLAMDLQVRKHMLAPVSASKLSALKPHLT
jgi:hypothetical protein